MCCCHDRRSRSARREERRRKRHEPANLRKRLSRFRLLQSVLLIIYLLHSVFSGDPSAVERPLNFFLAFLV